MDRREFLRRGVVLGSAAYLAGRMPWALGLHRTGKGELTVPGESMLELPAGEAPIDTIVVLMMENRSVDHYLGWLGRDGDYLHTGRRLYGKAFAFDGDNDQKFLDLRTPKPGDKVRTFHLPSHPEIVDHPYRGCGHPDPGHGWDSGRAQRDRGFLADGSGNDEYALGFYRAADLPFYASMAAHFTVFDRYHCSLLASTFPNREYLHSAQSGTNKGNSLPSSPQGFAWRTIWEQLRDRAGFVPGRDAAYFFVDLPAILLWGPRHLPFMQHVEEYFARAASGTLPKVTFLDPGFTTGLRTDDHPFADVRAGQKLVFDYVKAFVESPHWERGVFIITYDEWGGFFDHVPPPLLPDDQASTNDDENFGQAGFRVPTFMISPFALKGFVDHRLYDHTSILRFIEWRFLGAPPEGPGADTDTWFLRTRDRFANNIGASLRDPASLTPAERDRFLTRELDLPLLPQVPVDSPPCRGEELEGLPGPVSGVPDSRQPDPLEIHAFEQAYRAGFFERMGYEVQLRPLPTL